jgi:hypothetical protein
MSVLPAAPHRRQLEPVVLFVAGAVVLALTASVGDADWSGLADFLPDGWPRRRHK